MLTMPITDSTRATRTSGRCLLKIATAVVRCREIPRQELDDYLAASEALTFGNGPVETHLELELYSE